MQGSTCTVSILNDKMMHETMFNSVVDGRDKKSSLSVCN